jgi:hypothetical protein
LRIGEDVIPDPGHRQVGEDLVVLVEPVQLRSAARRGEQVGMGDHHALGRAGGARGVEDDRDVAGLALLDLGVEKARSLLAR